MSVLEIEGVLGYSLLAESESKGTEREKEKEKRPIVVFMLWKDRRSSQSESSQYWGDLSCIKVSRRLG